MLTLLEVLKNAMPKESVNVVSNDSHADELSEEDMMQILATEMKKTKFCTIVFVERRFTAKIVFMVLKVTAALWCTLHTMVLPSQQFCFNESCYRQVCGCQAQTFL
jgi:Lhr-like helicase